MALADYDTAVEKIAALRSAFIDPALVNYHAYGTTFNTSEPIYLVANNVDSRIGSLRIPRTAVGAAAMAMEAFGVPTRIGTGKAIDIQDSGWSFAYINDSDIVYSDPITTYQNRLAILYEAETIISGDFTVGEYGAILSYSNVYSGSLSINGSKVYKDLSGIMFPVKKDDAISYGFYNGSHIDLTADW